MLVKMSGLRTIQFFKWTLIFFILINEFHKSASVPDSKNVPCDLSDTVDLTGHTKLSNGSYSYEGLIIPPNLWGEYETTFDEFSVQVPAKLHIRGCVCKLKPCLKFCCPITSRFNGTHCEAFKGNTTSKPRMNITTSSGEVKEVELAKEFVIQYGHTCPHEMFHSVLNDSFSLFENGTLQSFNAGNLSKDEFCLSENFDSKTIKRIIVANLCPTPEPSNNGLTLMQIILSVSMLLSVFFIILTIIVYTVIPELRTLHGKTLCCYLSGLCCYYLILSALYLFNDIIDNNQCEVFGYFGYYSIMATFFWLNVICFELFYSIRGSSLVRLDERKRFIFYSLYGWGSALIFLIITYAADKSSFIPEYLKPAVGEYVCWVNTISGWAGMLYIYGPFAILFSFNIVMFNMTFRRIYSIKKNETNIMACNVNRRYLRTARDSFGIFLRLSIIMGVPWCTEIISYMFGKSVPALNNLFYITTIANGLHGILIFIFFVLRKKVRQYIRERYLSPSSVKHETEYSNSETSGSCDLPLKSTSGVENYTAVKN